jgi:uncharacterized alpha-E superfamily protein
MMLGRNLERADMTSRIIDVRSAQLVPAESAELTNFDTIQWVNLLKSLSGYQMYRLRARTRVSRAAALEFVLRDTHFPRACFFCLQEVGTFLRALPRSAAVMGSLAAACSFLKNADLERLDQPGLHEHIDLLQLHINVVHQGIARRPIFPPRRCRRSSKCRRSHPSRMRKKRLLPLAIAASTVTAASSRCPFQSRLTANGSRAPT